VEQLDFLQDLGSLLLEHVVFAGKLFNPLLDFIKLISQLTDLACGNPQFLLGLPVLVGQSLVFAVEPANLVGVGSVVLAQLAVQVLNLLEDLGAFLLEDVVLSGELVDSLFDFVEFVGEFSDLACGNSKFLLSLPVLICQGLVLTVKSPNLVSIVAIVLSKSTV
jgi:hypothetical protein